jgi:hypothetical protein
MLRAVRFAARFGFVIEPKTMEAIQRNAVRVVSVSFERIGEELSRMFTGSHPELALDLLDKSGLLEVVLPEVVALKGVEQSPEHHPEGDVYAHTRLMLKLFGLDLAIIAVIGILLLIGIVKKNAIMMIDFALDAERNQGMEPMKAIYQGCLIRFRPIMMTTMAALMGTLPIALGYGAGGEARQPLGLAVVGGLVFSQTVTLYLTPVVYTYLAGISEALRARRTGSGPSVPEFRLS